MGHVEILPATEVGTLHMLTAPVDGSTVNAYVLCFLGSGRTWDVDCSRSSTRLALAMKILTETTGARPVQVVEADGTTRTRWTAPVDATDLTRAWDAACVQVRDRARLARG